MREVESQSPAPVSGKTFFGHPSGLSTLFFTEMWERFSYYGMRAILILFMTAEVERGGLGMSVASAGVIYGLVTAGAYLAALPGGWIADRILGLQRAVVFGGVLIAIGNGLLFLPSVASFYTGLCFIVAGTGLLKPNVSAIVGQLYSESDNRRDAGFSIFYMGINLGSVTAPLLIGYVGERINWHYGFGIAAIGMTFGLIQFWFGRANLQGAGAQPAVERASAEGRQSRRNLTYVLVFGAIAVAGLVAAGRAGLITGKAIADVSATAMVAICVGFFAWLFFANSWTGVERRRLLAILILFIASCIFWSVFEQAGSTLNLFALERTDNQVGNFNVPASWYQSVNGLFIVLLAPVFAWIWLRLGSRDPSSPTKFVIGLALVGAGFLVLAFAAQLGASGVKVSPAWLLVTYLLHTMGELCLSPVGLSAMTKLAPVRVAGLMMGAWFLSISVGNYIGGRLAAFYEALELPFLFGAVGAFALAVGLLLAFIVKPVNRLMGGVR